MGTMTRDEGAAMTDDEVLAHYRQRYPHISLGVAKERQWVFGGPGCATSIQRFASPWGRVNPNPRPHPDPPEAIATTPKRGDCRVPCLCKYARTMSETFAELPDGRRAAHTVGLLAHILDPVDRPT